MFGGAAPMSLAVVARDHLPEACRTLPLAST